MSSNLPSNASARVPGTQQLPLHMAARAGAASAVRLLIAAAPEVQREGDGSGLAALHHAASIVCVSTVGLLLTQLSAWRQDRDGCLPLHAAVSAQHAGAAALLVQASPGTMLFPNKQGLTPLDLALWGTGDPTLPECLLAAAPADAALPRLAAAACAGMPKLVSDQLFAAFAASRLQAGPMLEAQWALLPSPCAGLGAALPAALACSPAQARHVVRRLPAADAERLRWAALCLPRVQRRLCVTLPSTAVEAILSYLVAA